VLQKVEKGGAPKRTHKYGGSGKTRQKWGPTKKTEARWGEVPLECSGDGRRRAQRGKRGQTARTTRGNRIAHHPTKKKPVHGKVGAGALLT